MNRTGRFAPSPTGSLHLGNLRTALLAWLFARSQSAGFLIRVEDLDRERVRPGVAEQQLSDLALIGLDWDGAPVTQSRRTELYAHALGRLDTYECWCSRKEVREAASAPHDDLPEGSYPGTCRTLTRAQVAERRRSGRSPALRVCAAGAEIAFADRVHGEVTTVLDDFVVRRNDGAYGYNLAVIVDDAEQGIGEVVRADDLLDTTARQIWIARQLGLEPPSFAHVPLMLGDDGERLAKRHGAVTLGERLELGQSAAAVRGELAASVGLCPAGAQPAAADLIAAFAADDFAATVRAD